MKYITKLIGSVLAGFSVCLGSVLTIVFLTGMVLDRNTDLLPLFLGSMALITFGLVLFKVFGYTIKKGLGATLNNIFWFV